MANEREAAQAAYIGWLRGCNGLLPPADDDAIRSEAGWLAFLAGYLRGCDAALAAVTPIRQDEADRVVERTPRAIFRCAACGRRFTTIDDIQADCKADTAGFGTHMLHAAATPAHQDDGAAGG